MKLEYLRSCNLCNSNQIETIDADCNICKCLSDGYIFDNPRPTADEIISFYSKAMKYDSWLSEEQARDALWKRRLRKMEKTRKIGTLLDIGTGIAQFLHHARKYYTEVYGTEVSESAINIAKNKYNLNIIKGETENIQFETTFDNITLFHVLEHVPSPRTVIEKCRSLLSTGGVLVIAVPNDILSLKTKVKIFLKKIGVKRFSNIGKLGLPKIKLDGSLDEIHLSHFTPEVLKQVLERSGFSVIENSLDPYYASSGVKLICHHLYYIFHLILMFVLKRNYYDTIYTVAKRNDCNTSPNSG